jgi:nucleoside-diphosphate-sugar epimerase
MSKKYLVTGGAGFLGINLVRFLLEKGHEVVSYDMADFTYKDVADKVTVIQGDIRDKEKVSKAIEGTDIVVHTAAALPLYSKEDIFSTDINGTQNVAEAAFTHNVERFIHISSTAVYGIPDHHPLYEDDPLDGVGPYGKAKIKAEEICLEYRKKGMCIPIIRPKSFIGPERLGVFAMFYEWADEGRSFPMLGNGKNRYQFLDVEDLCEAIYLTATGDKEKVNDTFNIGAKVFATMREDYQAVLDRAGHGKKIKTFPAGPVILMLRILEFLHLSTLSKWIYETVAEDSFVSMQKAEDILDFKPKYSNTDALLRNFEWYLANKDSFKDAGGVSHRVPWKQGILRIIKLFF